MALERIVFYGDSRVNGYGDQQDYPALPQAATTFGTPYTSLAGVTLTLTPAQGAPGSGYALALRRNPNNGKISAGVTARGSGYVSGQMPTIAITGGDGTPPDLVIPSQTAGGYTPGIEAYLRAHGYAGLTVLNLGVGGITATRGFANADSSDLISIEASAGDPATSLVYIILGVNDAIHSNATTGGNFATPTTFQTQLQVGVNRLVADGYPIVIDYPGGLTTSATAALQALNPMIRGFNTRIDTVIASSPYIHLGVDEYDLMTAHPEWTVADGLHRNADGDARLVSAKGARLEALLADLFPGQAGTGYNSDPSGWHDVPVNYKHTAPTFGLLSGLGTRAIPKAEINWINPDDFKPGDTLLLERRPKADPTNITTVATIVATGNPLALPTSYVDLTVINGILYQYRLTYIPATV